jgi:hypothetical protein
MGMRGLHRLLLAGAAALWASAASAQMISLPPSKLIDRMTPPQAERGVPDYDPDMLAAKLGGTVRVELVFSAPDSEPVMRLLSESVDAVLVESVRRHVRILRVPCQPEGAEPARLVQEYVFRPDDGRKVLAFPLEDQAALELRRQAACLTRIVPGRIPEYPERARRLGQEGNFLVRLRFASPTLPPEFSFLAGPAHPALRDALTEFAAGYRLPCQAGEPREIDQLYQYRFHDGDRTVIKDLTLPQFLGSAASMPLPAEFDLTTMGCPFDVRITHYQPYKRNIVQQVETSRPERRSFLDWLSHIPLRLSTSQTLAVMGDTFTVRVPCSKLAL